MFSIIEIQMSQWHNTFTAQFFFWSHFSHLFREVILRNVWSYTNGWELLKYTVYGTVSFTENWVHYTPQTRLSAVTQKGQLVLSFNSYRQPQRDKHCCWWEQSFHYYINIPDHLPVFIDLNKLKLTLSKGSSTVWINNMHRSGSGHSKTGSTVARMYRRVPEQ